MKWVLIILIFTSGYRGGVAVHSVEMSSERACHRALEEMRLQDPDRVHLPLIRGAHMPVSLVLRCLSREERAQ